MTSCYRQEYGISNFPVCSGHGDCFDGICHCHPGWTSISELELQPGYDCDININTVRYWSGFNVMVGSIASLFVIYCLYFENIFIGDKSIFRGNVKSISILFFLLDPVLIVIFSYPKLIDVEKYVIGSHSSHIVSIAAPCSLFCIFTSLGCFFLILVKFLNGYSKFIETKLRSKIMWKVRMMCNMVIAFPFITGAIYTGIVVGCTTSSVQDSDKYSTAYIAVFTLAYLFYSCTIIYVLLIFLRELKIYLQSTQQNHESTRSNESSMAPLSKFSMGKSSNHSPEKRFSINIGRNSRHFSNNNNNSTNNRLKDTPSKRTNGSISGNIDSTTSQADKKSTTHENVKVVYDNFVYVLKTLGPVSLGGFPLNLIFLCWPFLRRKFTYFLMLQSTSVCLINPFMVISLLSVNAVRKARIPSFMRINFNFRPPAPRKLSRALQLPHEAVLKIVNSIIKTSSARIYPRQSIDKGSGVSTGGESNRKVDIPANINEEESKKDVNDNNGDNNNDSNIRDMIGPQFILPETGKMTPDMTPSSSGQATKNGEKVKNFMSSVQEFCEIDEM